MEQDAWVVVPMYNESTVVAQVIGDLHRYFAHVVCIDDGSSDGSADVARDAGALVVRHPDNLGQGAALQTGFDWIRLRTAADHVVTFDADGQHHARDARAMVDLARAADLEVVLGSRNRGRSEGQEATRRLILRAGLAFSRVTTGLTLTDTHNGLRVLSRSALERIVLRQPGMAYASELEAQVARLGLRWAEAPVTVSYTAYSRAKGQSNLNAINIVCDLMSAKMRTAS